MVGKTDVDTLYCASLDPSSVSSIQAQQFASGEVVCDHMSHPFLPSFPSQSPSPFPLFTLKHTKQCPCTPHQRNCHLKLPLQMLVGLWLQIFLVE